MFLILKQLSISFISIGIKSQGFFFVCNYKLHIYVTRNLKYILLCKFLNLIKILFNRTLCSIKMQIFILVQNLHTY